MTQLTGSRPRFTRIIRKGWWILLPGVHKDNNESNPPSGSNQYILALLLIVLLSSIYNCWKGINLCLFKLFRGLIIKY